MNLSIFQIIELAILAATTLYHAITSHQENQQLPPGTITTTDKAKIHWYTQGSGQATIIVDHSLGGVEGYLLIDKLAKLGQVIIFDRPGYGWSKPNWQPRTSQQINLELQSLLQAAQIPIRFA